MKIDVRIVAKQLLYVLHVYQPTNKSFSDKQQSSVTSIAVTIIRFQFCQAKMYPLSNIETHKARRENFRFKPQSLLGQSDVAFGCNLAQCNKFNEIYKCHFE